MSRFSDDRSPLLRGQKIEDATNEILSDAENDSVIELSFPESAPLLPKIEKVVPLANKVGDAVQTGIGIASHFEPSAKAANELVTAARAARKVSEIQKIIDDIQRLHDDSQDEDFQAICVYVIGKLNANKKNVGLGGYPIVGSLFSAFQNFKKISQPTSARRSRYAERIWDGYRGQQPGYASLVRLIVGDDTFDAIARGDQNAQGQAELIAKCLSANPKVSL